MRAAPARSVMAVKPAMSAKSTVASRSTGASTPRPAIMAFTIAGGTKRPKMPESEARSRSASEVGSEVLREAQRVEVQFACGS